MVTLVKKVWSPGNVTTKGKDLQEGVEKYRAVLCDNFRIVGLEKESLQKTRKQFV